MQSTEQRHQEQTTVHLLPCSIEHDGPLAVSSYFQIKKEKLDLKASLRGRELVGKEVQLPQRVCGVHAVQGQRTQKTEATWEYAGQFKKLVVWQHDVAPELGPINECFDWFDIADKVRLHYSL